MHEPGPQELSAARAHLQSVRALLEHPRTCHVEECLALLRAAQGQLELLRDRFPAARPAALGWRAQVVALAVEIRQAGVLLERAVRLGRRWLDGLQSGSGYTVAGVVAPLQVRGRLSIVG